jgi:hypothetical protein
MKKIIAICILSGFMFSACENYREENEALKADIERLQEEKIEQEMLLNSFGETMMLIQQNLAEIRQRESNIQRISTSGKENLISAKQEIVDDLEAIQNMMDENRENLDELNKKLSRYGRQIGNLKSLTDNMTLELAKRDSSIAMLHQDLEKRNFRIAELQEQMDLLREKKQRELEEKEDMLNRAFYVSGVFKELEEKGVVDKSGGFIGIGRVKTLQDDPDRSNFIEIDKRTFVRLSIDRKKAELLSNHPRSSYEWEMEDKTIKALIVKDKEAFWKSGSTLVVLLD